MCGYVFVDVCDFFVHVIDEKFSFALKVALVFRVAYIRIFEE